MFLFSLANSLIRGSSGNLFGHRIAPNSTSNTPSSGNILADASVATQLDGILKEEHILLFVPCLFDGITAGTSGRGITAYIYYRSALIRLGLLSRIGPRCIGLPARSLCLVIISLIKQAGTYKRND